jgi:hypothetical protein
MCNVAGGSARFLVTSFICGSIPESPGPVADLLRKKLVTSITTTVRSLLNFTLLDQQPSEDEVVLKSESAV